MKLCRQKAEHAFAVLTLPVSANAKRDTKDAEPVTPRETSMLLLKKLGSCLAEPFMIGFKARYANEKQVCNSFKNF